MPNFEKYIGLSFKHKGRDFNGVDCYGLLALLLKEEKDIEMPEYEYTFNWCEEGCNHIKEKMHYFTHWKILKEPSKPLDVILFYDSPESKVVSHMGIYIGDNRFIHVSSLYSSRSDKLEGHWLKRVYKVLRCDFG